MELLILIALATVFYTLFDVFASQAGNKIDSNLSSVIFNGLGAIIPLLTYFYLKLSKSHGLISTSKNGIVYSVLAGVSIAVFSILLIKIFEKSGLAYVIPLIYGGSIALSVLTGILVFKESTNIYQILGILLIMAGVSFVVYSKI